MRTSHALLLRLRHDPGFEFDRAKVVYLDRGAPGDRSIVTGNQILSLKNGGMEIESDMKTKFIPIHRIRQIIYDEEIIWQKSEDPISSS